MRNMILLGCAIIGLALTPAHAKEEGEQIYRCWRFEKDPVQLWRMESIEVSAHDAREAISMCDNVQRDRIRRQNRRVVRT